MRAVFWYRKAAEQRDLIAQNNLGVMYEQGRGVPQDYEQAAAWYRKAAEHGEIFAQRTSAYSTATAVVCRRITFSPTCGLTWQRHNPLSMRLISGRKSQPK